MTLARPEFLVVAAVTPLAAAWLVRTWSRKRAAALGALGDPAVLARAGVVLDDRTRRLRWILRALALTCVMLALARPQGDAQDTRSGRSGRDLIVALDLSRSMQVQDADGTRLQRARVLAADLADRMGGDRLGLVIFGGAAFLQLPLTADHAVFERFVEMASPEAIDDPGTDVASALDVARTVFEHEGGDGHRAIIVLSDGERSEGRLQEPLDELVSARIPVFTIGIGTPRGGFVPADPMAKSDSGSRWHLDNIGRPAESRLDEEALKRIATATGGFYASWDDASARQEMVSRIRRIAERPLGTQRVTQHVELFQWPLALAVLLLLLEAAVALSGAIPGVRPLRPLRPVRLAPRASALLAALLASCSGDAARYRHALGLYHDSEYPAAFDAFTALEKSRDPRVQLAAGNAAYRVNRYEDAEKSYRRAAGAQGIIGKAARFNLGNSWFRAAQAAPQREYEFYGNAIAAYEEVLRIDPTDEDARWNLELALRKQAEYSTGGSPGRGGRAQAGVGDGNEEGLDSEQEQAVGAMAGGGSGDAAGESAEELSSDEARRLLEQVEREQLSEHDARPGRRGGRAERDW